MALSYFSLAHMLPCRLITIEELFLWTVAHDLDLMTTLCFIAIVPVTFKFLYFIINKFILKYINSCSNEIREKYIDFTNIIIKFSIFETNLSATYS
jgi:hypothetical protein